MDDLQGEASIATTKSEEAAIGSAALSDIRGQEKPGTVGSSFPDGIFAAAGSGLGNSLNIDFPEPDQGGQWVQMMLRINPDPPSVASLGASSAESIMLLPEMSADDPVLPPAPARDPGPEILFAPYLTHGTG